jgi:serine/threonine protein kinase
MNINQSAHIDLTASDCHAEVCLGLYVLHTNKILHRDIKAANIFVGDNDCIKVYTSVSPTAPSAGSKQPCHVMLPLTWASDIHAAWRLGHRQACKDGGRGGKNPDW